jgi:hypothetical protein
VCPVVLDAHTSTHARRQAHVHHNNTTYPYVQCDVVVDVQGIRVSRVVLGGWIDRSGIVLACSS